MSDQVMAKKDGAWQVISLAPDVCKTPRGSSTPAVPYPVVAKLGDAVQVLEHIRSNGKPLVVFDQSQVPQTLGDQAGTATGVKSGTVGDKCEPKGHSGTVNAGGKPTLRHGDDFWMNSRNTVGVIVGETSPAPVPAAQANPPLAAEIPDEDQTGFTVISMVQSGTNLSALANAMGEHAQLVNAGLMNIAGDEDGASAVMLQVATTPPPPNVTPRPASSPGNGARSVGKSKQRKVPPTNIEFRHVYADGSGIAHIPYTAYLSTGAVINGKTDGTGLGQINGQPAGATARITYGSNPHPGSCNIQCASHPEADSFISHTFHSLSDEFSKSLKFVTSGEVLDSLWDQVVGDFHWLKAVVYGQFEDDRPLSAMVADMLVSFVPGVIIATSARDLTAVIIRMVRRPERRDDVSEWILLIACVIPLALPLIGAAAGAIIGAIAGSELGAFLRAACLILLDTSGTVLVKLIGFLRKFVKGDIVKLLKQIDFAHYADAVVQYLAKYLSKARELCFRLRQELAKLPFASQFTKTIQKLQELEHAFYDIQTKAISKIPLALSELNTRLANALKQTAKDEPHAAFPGTPAPEAKPPIKPGEQQHAGVNNNPLGTPPKTTNVPPPPKVEPETNLHVVKTEDEGAKSLSRSEAIAKERDQITQLSNAGRIDEARKLLEPYVLRRDYKAIIERLDVSTPPNSAGFWSGNKFAAKDYANENGKFVLESTAGGKVVDDWSLLNDSLPWKEGGEQFWGGLSNQYAKGVSGDIFIMQTPERAMGADGSLTWNGGYVWQNYEKPVVDIYQESGRITSIDYMLAPSN